MYMRSFAPLDDIRREDLLGFFEDLEIPRKSINIRFFAFCA